MGDVSNEFQVRVSNERDARAWVRARAARARENFSVMSVFVARELRDDFAAIYAFCRVSDDLADETGADEAARARSGAMLREWREMVIAAHGRAMERGCSAGEGSHPATHPVMWALEHTIARHRLALRHFTDLLDAFEEDQRVTRWPSLEDLVRYSSRSANPVGRLVLSLYGAADRADHGPSSVDSRRLFAASDALCTALQLTNFWQDVRQDLLQRDRIYVPCRQIGIEEAQLKAWIHGPRDASVGDAFSHAMRSLHESTYDLFRTGREVIDLAPQRARRVLALFWLGGVRTLDRVVAAKGIELWERPRLSDREKLVLVARGFFGQSPRARTDGVRA